MSIPINSLTGLKHLVILTSRLTASASKAVINGLKPFLGHRLQLIGRQTVGKGKASTVLVDRPESDYLYLTEVKIPLSEKFGMQLIFARGFNSEGTPIPRDGFLPDFEMDEVEGLIREKKPLGDPEERLLRAALDLIAGKRPVLPANSESADRLFGTLIYSNIMEENTFGKNPYRQAVSKV